jgi:hypothetical protein
LESAPSKKRDRQPWNHHLGLFGISTSHWKEISNQNFINPSEFVFNSKFWTL